MESADRNRAALVVAALVPMVRGVLRCSPVLLGYEHPAIAAPVPSRVPAYLFDRAEARRQRRRVGLSAGG
jgi:hypothetical protein